MYSPQCPVYLSDSFYVLIIHSSYMNTKLSAPTFMAQWEINNTNVLFSVLFIQCSDLWVHLHGMCICLYCRCFNKLNFVTKYSCRRIQKSNILCVSRSRRAWVGYENRILQVWSASSLAARTLHSISYLLVPSCLYLNTPTGAGHVTRGMWQVSWPSTLIKYGLLTTKIK